MKLRILASLCLLCLSQLVLAQMPPKPETCPALSSLKSQPFFMAQKPEGALGFMAMSMGKYNTNDNWGFLMAFIEADDTMEAIMIANENLPNIAGTPEPMAVEELNIWACVYNVEGTPYQAVAGTPLAAPGQLLRIMKR